MLDFKGVQKTFYCKIFSSHAQHPPKPLTSLKARKPQFDQTLTTYTLTPYTHRPICNSEALFPRSSLAFSKSGDAKGSSYTTLRGEIFNLLGRIRSYTFRRQRSCTPPSRTTGALPPASPSASLRYGSVLVNMPIARRPKQSR